MADEITDAEIAELRRRMDPHGENLLQSEADRVVSLVPGLLARLERERDEANARVNAAFRTDGHTHEAHKALTELREAHSRIAEVRALRECERALELLIGRIPPDADPFESGDLWIGASGIIAARAALAAVRALEDKP